MWHAYKITWLCVLREFRFFMHTSMFLRNSQKKQGPRSNQGGVFCLFGKLSIFRNWKEGIEIRLYPAFIYFVMYKNSVWGFCLFLSRLCIIQEHSTLQVPLGFILRKDDDWKPKDVPKTAPPTQKKLMNWVITGNKIDPVYKFTHMN